MNWETIENDYTQDSTALQTMTHTQLIQGLRVKIQRLAEKKEKPWRRKVTQRRKAWMRTLINKDSKYEEEEFIVIEPRP